MGKKGLEDFMNDINIQKTAAAPVGADGAPVAPEQGKGMDFITKLAQEIQSSDAAPAAAAAAPPALPTEQDTAAIDAAAAAAAAAATAASPPKSPAEVNAPAASPTGVGSSPAVQQALANVIGPQGAPDTAELTQEAPVQAVPDTQVVSDADQLVESPQNFNQAAEAQANEAAGGGMDSEKLSSAIVSGANEVLEKFASVYTPDAAQKVAEAYNGDLEKIGSIQATDENEAVLKGAQAMIIKMAGVYGEEVAGYIADEIEKIAGIKTQVLRKVVRAKQAAKKAGEITGVGGLISAQKRVAKTKAGLIPQEILGPQRLKTALAERTQAAKVVAKRLGIPLAAAAGGYGIAKAASAVEAPAQAAPAAAPAQAAPAQAAAPTQEKVAAAPAQAAPAAAEAAPTLDDINAAVEIIKEAGLQQHVLDASKKGYDCSDAELVKLGHQIVDQQEGMIKEAENADRFGRQMARSYVDELEKIAEGGQPSTGLEKLAAAGQAQPAAAAAPDQTQVNQAIETLRAAKVIQ